MTATSALVRGPAEGAWTLMSARTRGEEELMTDDSEW